VIEDKNEDKKESIDDFTNFHRMGTDTPIEEMQDLRRSRVKEADFSTFHKAEKAPSLKK